ncbi:STAS domain-containing protein [Parablastomonas sp. CN1-191]|uniref:STAS domain-containing protein n=1 Tax=Parablastomonas sp. CN1-191 TaxID=3400908 RepID=UPI003BF91CC0
MTDPAVLEITVPDERIDAAAAPAFKQAMSDALGSSTRRLVLDMSQVQFVDSTGLGVLVSLLKQMGEGGRIAVVGAAPGVRRLFQITRLDSLFVLADDAASARDALNG